MNHITKEEFVIKFQTRLAELEHARSMLEGVIMRRAYVIRVGDRITVELKTGEDGLVNGVNTIAVEHASRYTKEDASIAATNIRNRLGETGRAVHIKDALDQEISDLKTILEEIA